MKYFIFFAFFLFCFGARAQNYSSSMDDAIYLATLKAVLDYKMNDEQNLENLQTLREDEEFNQKLRKILSKLSNNRQKPFKDRRIYEMLIKDGKAIYNELN